MLPYRIYLSGGGMCAMAHVGALIELSKHVPLKAIREWMGVSAGSLVAMCLCIGFTLDELEDFCVRFDFTNIKEYDSVPGWLLHFGIDTGERLHKLIEACLHVKGLSSDFTFKECHEKFGLSLKVVATDLNEAIPITYSPFDTPNYRLSDAVRASMTYPYYFQPHICPVTNHYLIDGGVISNYPLFVIPKEEHNRTLSILIRTSVDKVDDLMELDIDKLITRPLLISLIEKNNNEAKTYDARCIQIRLGNLNILEFSFDEETKNFIIKKGKDAVNEFFKNGIKIERRHSVS
jgi:NTE family protein